MHVLARLDDVSLDHFLSFGENLKALVAQKLNPQLSMLVLSDQLTFVDGLRAFTPIAKSVRIRNA